MCYIILYQFEILTALDSYLTALELDASSDDIPYRILPLFVKAKYNENLLEPLKVSYTLRIGNCKNLLSSNFF